ncbi:MAG: pyridoxamine 5'-phosphate oxidase family protein [Aggregatilineales bacterium]
MAKDYATMPATEMRRNDRAVEDESWIVDFLETAAIGTMASVHDGQPFMNTNLFIYDANRHCVYTHTARVGRTRANLELDRKVSFSIMEMGRMLPAPEALEFSVEYAGVMIFGTASIVDDEAEATDALQQLLDKYSPHLTAGQDYRPPVPEELKRTSVFRIDIEQWSGKKKEVETHDGAFWYPEAPILTSVQQRPTWNGQLSGIYISAEKGQPLQPVDNVAAVANRGLRGDRHFNDGEILPDREITDVTLIAAEDIAAVIAETGFDLDVMQTRRNLLTQGVPLNYLVGKTFKIGGVLLRGVDLCDPCNSMAEKSGYGAPLLKAMVRRGGLRAQILSDGVIDAGARICPVENII